jgi:hypothetical protein
VNDSKSSCCVNKKLNRDRAGGGGGGGGSSFKPEGKKRDFNINGKRDERSAH